MRHVPALTLAFAFALAGCSCEDKPAAPPPVESAPPPAAVRPPRDPNAPPNMQAEVLKSVGAQTPAQTLPGGFVAAPPNDRRNILRALRNANAPLVQQPMPAAAPQPTPAQPAAH